MVWSTTKWGALLGSVFGAIVGCLALVSTDVFTDGTTHDAIGAGAFGAVIGSIVGALCGTVLGLASGCGAAITRHYGGDRAATTAVGALVAGLPFVALAGGRAVGVVAGVLVGTIAGGALWWIQRERPAPASPARGSGPPRWGDPSAG